MNETLDTTRTGNREKLAQIIKDMEIPDFKTWAASALAPDQAKSWPDLYAVGLARNESDFEQLFIQLAQLRGQISARKVSDASRSAEQSESVLLASLRQPVDVYVAEWRDTSVAPGDPIGYFFFLNGRFRWDSAIMLPKPRSTTRTIVPPRLVKRVEPIYPLSAQAEGVNGIVALRIRVQLDGRPLIEDAASGDDRLVPAAKEAVRQWHFEPASANGKPIEVEITVEVDFVLMRAP